MDIAVKYVLILKFNVMNYNWNEFNSMIVVKVTDFRGSTTPDKNLKPTLMLQLLAGKMPNRQTRAGTVAEFAGFEKGKTYLAQVRPNGFDKVFGWDFNYLAIEELHGVDIYTTIQQVGPPELLMVDKPAASESYVRKTDKVKSARQVRIDQGLYIPLFQTEPTSSTSPSVEGATVETEQVSQAR